MKNKEFYKLLRKNKSNSNSGFTLTELLVGLFMSIFVVGALGFGLMTVLRATKSETSKVAARNETSRALDFISDEVRRASTIESVATNANGFTSTGRTVVLALDIPEVGGDSDPDGDGNLFGVDNNTTTSERIVYFLQSSTGTNWKGPLVLYRYGPPLDANGNYTDETWGSEALIDGIDDTVIATNPCTVAGGTLSPTTARGFHACVSGGNTAQLFLTGGTDTASGGTDTYTADTRVVARARAALPNRVNNFSSINWDFEDIGGNYHGGVCNPSWQMRTDFDTNSDEIDTIPWIRTPNRQPQPIEVDPTKTLTISSSPVGATGCTSRGNDGTTGTELLSTYTVKPSHTIDFGNPITFNGDRDGSDYNVTQVDSTKPGVQFLKLGSNVPMYGGFDENNDGDLSDPNDQPTLGRFLYGEGRAVPLDPTASVDDPNTQFVIPETPPDPVLYPDFKLLGEDQRIIAFEVGQTEATIGGNPNPGFDLQDNIFVVTSDIFKKKFPAGCFSGSCPAP